jgi:hypothetical protein
VVVVELVDVVEVVVDVVLVVDVVVVLVVVGGGNKQLLTEITTFSIVSVNVSQFFIPKQSTLHPVYVTQSVLYTAEYPIASGQVVVVVVLVVPTT